MLTKVLWSLLVIAVVNVTVFLVSYAVYVRRPPVESPAPPFLLLPLMASAFVATFVGGLCGLALLMVSDEGLLAQVILVAITLILFTCAGLGITWFRREGRLYDERTRLSERLLPTEEVLALIRAGQVKSFSKRGDKLVVFLEPGAAEEEGLDLRRADPQDYAALVAAANEVYDQVGEIRYHNDSGPDDPSGQGHRWITPEEATALLDAGKIKTFSYGPPGLPFAGPEHRSRMTFHGTPTGIQLTDHGWVRHIYVTPDMQSTMIPIARAAKARLGKPQFSINGRYE